MTRGCRQAGHPGQPDPQVAVAPSKSQPIRRSLVDGQLLPQGEVLEGELVVAAAQEREEPEHVEQEGDHRAGFSPDQSRLINHLGADGVLAKWATDRFSATLPQEALTDFITTASSSATCDAPGIGTPRGATR